jgi:hypothetical protein
MHIMYFGNTTPADLDCVCTYTVAQTKEEMASAKQRQALVTHDLLTKLSGSAAEAQVLRSQMTVRPVRALPQVLAAWQLTAHIVSGAVAVFAAFCAHKLRYRAGAWRLNADAMLPIL